MESDFSAVWTDPQQQHEPSSRGLATTVQTSPVEPQSAATGATGAGSFIEWVRASPLTYDEVMLALQAFNVALVAAWLYLELREDKR